MFRAIMFLNFKYKTKLEGITAADGEALESFFGETQ